jgi:para-aminobenzoate synthetase/4-amino-4-deoxychorismate lyase
VPAEEAALLVASDEHPFALVGGWAGSRAITGSEPLCVAGPDDDPFELLGRLPSVDGAADHAVGGGWFGYLGYGLGETLEPVSPGPPRPLPLLRSSLALYDHVLRLDAEGQWWFEALFTPDRAGVLSRRRDLLAQRLASPPPRHGAALGAFRPTGSGAEGHRAAVAECRERIAGGELFQANLCMRLESAWDGDPAQLFCRLAGRLAPPLGAYLAGPWGAVASMSPELFLRRRGRTAWTEPIKGTTRRGTNGREDAELREALEGSAKDRAENVMIVDLMRNDLGRVSAYGSVSVDALAEARPGAGVWHLVSRVSGTLRPDATDADLLRATFPPGSVTGAPKVQTLRVIHELEATGREVYTGAIGYASPLAGLELSVAIRTFELSRDRVWLGVGGGITWSSDPDREVDECLTKAAPLVAAGGGRLEEWWGGTRSAAATVPRALGHGADRPDPELGVFETVRVMGGEPLDLDLHLHRLAASARDLFDAELPGGLSARARALARGLDGAHGGLRLALAPDGHGSLAATCEKRAASPESPPAGFLVSPWLLPGGLGAHKWRDRRLVDGLAARAAGVPLLVDGDDSVLEAAWGNVWIIEGERVVTPPDDGRLLPGVTRARLLLLAGGLDVEVVEDDIPLERLREADGLFLTSALRGAVPARLGAWPEPHPLVRMLALSLLDQPALTESYERGRVFFVS